MRSKALFLITLIILTGLTACNTAGGKPLETISGSGNVITESRDVSGFTAVTLQGLGEVIIDRTGSESLTITTDDNIMPYLETVVKGDTLFIRTTEEVAFTNLTELTFHLTATTLDAIELAGAGSFTIHDLDSEKWQVTLPGAGSITVSGQTTEQTVKMDGAGSYFAENLESEEATIESSGAGTAVVQVSKILDVTINGLGNVEYIGDPQVTQEIKGVGSVRKRSELTDTEKVVVIWPGSHESVDAQPVLQWEPFPDANHYQITITNTDTDAVVFRENTNEMVLPVSPALPAAANYTWIVQAQAENGEVIAEAHSFFRVKDSLTAVWPSNGESVDNKPILQWEAYPGVSEYHLMVVDDDAYPPVVVFDQTVAETMMEITPELEAGSFSWTVQALDRAGNIMAELNSQFRVKAPVEAVAPVNFETAIATPTLVWKAVADVVTYQVILLDDDAYPPIVITDQETSDTSLAISNSLEPGSYSWTVWAKDSNGVIVAEANSQFVVAP